MYKFGISTMKKHYLILRKVTMKTLILALLIAFSSLANAETDLYTEAFTWHPFNKGMNWHNRLIAVESRHIIGGYFYNSYRKDTFFTAYIWHKQLSTNWEGSFLLGVDYGYTNCIKGEAPTDGGKKVCPFPSAGLTYTKYKVQPTLLLFGPSISVTFKWKL